MHPKHQRFVDEYLIDLDARNAAIRAGYRPAAAHMTSHNILRRPEIAAAIAEAMAARARRTGVTVERVLREYARLAVADPRGLVSVGEAGVALRVAGALSDVADAAPSLV